MKNIRDATTTAERAEIARAAVQSLTGEKLSNLLFVYEKRAAELRNRILLIEAERAADMARARHLREHERDRVNGTVARLEHAGVPVMPLSSLEVTRDVAELAVGAELFEALVEQVRAAAVRATGAASP